MSGLLLNNVVLRLDGRQLVGMTASVLPGDALTIMGSSGSGKSSLLAYIGGFLDPLFEATGEVSLNGQSLTGLPAHKRRIGILFQDPLLFPHMSVGENLLFAMPPTVKGAARIDSAKQALDNAGLDGFLNRDPATLSGGQKARVALMRVLLAQPAALLLDEPFSKLDADRRDQIRQLVFEEARRENLPVVLVTHDEEDAVAAGGEIIRLASEPADQ